MTLEDLKKAYEENARNLSDEAQAAILNTLDDLEDEEEPDEEEIETTLWDHVDNTFIYTQEAYDYLENQHILDFSEAIQEMQASTPEQIAFYFLDQEIRDIVG